MLHTRQQAQRQARRGTRTALLSLSFAAFALSDRSLLSQADHAPVKAPDSAQSSPKPQTSEAYTDYLHASAFALEGSIPEALRLLATSIRLQPQDNPAASMIFELINERRANTPVKLLGHTEQITHVVYSQDGTKILTTSRDHTARLWDAHTGVLLHAPFQHEEPVLTAAFCPGGKSFLTGTADGHIRVWDTDNPKSKAEAVELDGDVNSVACSPDGRFVAAATEDGQMQLWNRATLQPILPLVRYHEAANQVSFSADSSKLVAASADGFADRFTTIGARLQPTLKHRNIVSTAVFSPDGKSILTASRDGSGALWNAETGTSRGLQFPHHAALLSASFSSDGTRVLTTSLDHTACLWDARNGRMLAPPLQHPALVIEGAWSPDARLVATVASDSVVRVWNAATGDLAYFPIHSRTGQSHVAFSPDNRSLIVIQDRTATLLNVPPVEAAPLWLADLADFEAGLHSDYSSQSGDPAKVEAMQKTLAALDSQDTWGRFGRWYFASSATRGVSPLSDLSLDAYVHLLIGSGDKPSLEYARALSSGHMKWIETIDALPERSSTDPAVQTAHRQ